MLRHHRAVQIQEQRIDRPGMGEALQQFAGNAFIGIAGDAARRRGGTPEQRLDLMAGAL